MTDTERLDWIEKNKAGIIRGTMINKKYIQIWRIMRETSHGVTYVEDHNLRDAIDRAIAEEKK